MTLATHFTKPLSHQAPKGSSGLGLRLSGLGKSFGNRRVLQGIDLDIRAGEFVAIVGRSGCGKSTLLRLVADIETPSEGEFQQALPTRLTAGSTAGLAAGASAKKAEKRIMFQESRLLPWRRVIDNVALGLPLGQREKALEVLAQVGLADRANDWPAKLSGGQRQRVALARALVHQPDLLLLDEPLGALDALTRIEMHSLIESLWLSRGFTALLVTHDVHEAVVLADRVILIEEGQIGLDVAIDLPRPRSTADARLAQIEKQILDRVLGQPEALAPAMTSHSANESNWLHTSAQGLRWAI